MTTTQAGSKRTLGLTVGALGVVYGDIGTSPLYALRECFHGTHGLDAVPENILGVLSLICWSLTAIVSVKYLGFVLRADNKGEGGILSLLPLALGNERTSKRTRTALVTLGVFGAALLYGDGMLTPCVTVLGAIEGLEVATPMFTHYVVPITVVILLLLFTVQRIGTTRVGRIFGPVMFIWFVVLAVLGVRGILMAPHVLSALSPHYAVRFFMTNGASAFVVLGAVFLAVTGAEALYADLGHFGKKPIRRAWFVAVFPALMLNYLGQGGLLLSDPEAAVNPFYKLAPEWALYALVILASIAAVIASQALISGAFSISMQAIQLGYLPRMEIRHTSAHERGQIYLPLVNWLLMISCVALVLGFQSSSRLASAYGIAVTLTMVITTILFYFASRHLWNWSVAKAGTCCGLFVALELAFFGATALKILHGGWFQIVVATALFTLMTTWKTGRTLLGQRLAASGLPLDQFVASIALDPPTRVKGTAIFMSGNPSGTPLALLHNLKHNRVLHERAVLLTVTVAETPHVNASERVRVDSLGHGLYRVVGRCGFMEQVTVTQLIEACVPQGLELNNANTTFFLSRETIVPSSRRPGMALWREHLFAFLARNAQPATAFFRVPANQVVELGMQVEF
jgi:KUP system potassium uptake protein